MNRKELEEKITNLVAYQVCLEVDEIEPTSDFVNDLGFDSLDAVEMVMAIEDEFDMDIKDEDAQKMTTISHITNYVEKNMED